jgi:hypothetical protein
LQSVVALVQRLSMEALPVCQVLLEQMKLRQQQRHLLQVDTEFLEDGVAVKLLIEVLEQQVLLVQQVDLD